MVKADVKSAVRVLELLEQFGEAQGPLRLKEVARRLGYPVSSTASLLKSVANKGYLAFDAETHQYLPTSKISDLGKRFSEAMTETAFLRETVKVLHQSTSEFIVVGAPNDIYIDYIEAIKSSQEIQLYAPVGTRRLMVQSGMGWLLLSRMDEVAVRRIYNRTIVAGEINKRDFSEEELLARLKPMREKDFVLTRGADYTKKSAPLDGAIVATLLPPLPSSRQLILAAGGPATRIEANLDLIVDAMRTAVEKFAALTAGVRNR